MTTRRSLAYGRVLQHLADLRLELEPAEVEQLRLAADELLFAPVVETAEVGAAVAAVRALSVDLFARIAEERLTPLLSDLQACAPEPALAAAA